MVIRLISCIGLAFLVGCVAPSASYWVSESRVVESLDYGPWDALLRAHVDDGFVDYPAFAASEEFAEFRRALRRARFTSDTTRAHRLALWLNGYNAGAIIAVLAGGSPEKLLGRARFFWRQRVAVGGEEITLGELEDGRIRRVGDPRTHFAIVCASASCPRLASQAFLPSLLDVQLEERARLFINDATRNRFDADAKIARLSQIFEWHAEDFEAKDGSVLKFVSRFVDDPELASKLGSEAWEIEYLPYDWRLNGRPLSSD